MKTAKKIIKTALLVLTPILVIALLGLSVWVFKVNKNINQRIAKGWLPPSTNIYSLGENLVIGAKFTKTSFLHLLDSHKFKSKKIDAVKENQFQEISPSECLPQLLTLADDLEGDFDLLKTCYLLKTKSQDKILVAFNIYDKIFHLFTNEVTVDSAPLPDHLVAQLFESISILRSKIEVGDVPLQCLQAITAVEDRQFLNHDGFSIKGILRAAFKNLVTGSISEGASTITQQLVKNYFLTPQRTLKRKFKELVIAVLIENKVSKDSILSAYLNIIYLGQNGPFQIRGYGAASRYYFQKEVGQLNLSECALLAAIVNSPRRFNPFINPENALKRREKVLSQMLKEKHISNQEYNTASQSQLPKKSTYSPYKEASYYLDAVKVELSKINLSYDDDIDVFTSLSPFRQNTAQQSLSKAIEKIESNTKLFGNEKVSLQASLLNIDVRTGQIRTLIGGRKYQSSQFNRVLKSKRQVGSLFKPFVYLTSFEKKAKNQEAPLSSLSLIPDELKTYTYEGQTWQPRNYTRKYLGQVPLFYALKNSLNAPTAHLAMDLGIPAIIATAKNIGIESELKNYPSLSLGAQELGHIELAQAYINLANLRRPQNIHIIREIKSRSSGESLFQPEPESLEPKVSSVASAKILGILQTVAKSGTARSIHSWRGFKHTIAGKTGTTNDGKDAWFVGFTPDTLTLVWVGHDKNLKTKLTGSNAALPIWSGFMKPILNLFPEERLFPHPNGTLVRTVLPKNLLEMLPNIKDHENIETQLIFTESEADQLKFLEAPENDL